MTLNELKSQIVNNKLSNLYLFTGDEWKVMNIYIDEIVKMSGKEKKYVDSVLEIMPEIRNDNSLFKKNYVYIVRDDYECIDSLDAIKSMLHNDILILIYSSIDKRNKLYKQNKDTLIVFEKMSESTLLNYCLTECELNTENLLKLIHICDGSLGRILLEINKIKNFSDDQNKAFKTLLENGQIYEPPKDAVFDLVDAILCRQPIASYIALTHCKRIGESNLVILSNLFTSTKQVLQVQAYEGNDIVNATSLTSWQIKKAKEKIYHYSNRELIDIMKLIQRVESGIKVGTFDESTSVEYILEEIFYKNGK